MLTEVYQQMKFKEVREVVLSVSLKAIYHHHSLVRQLYFTWRVFKPNLASIAIKET